MLLRRCSSDLTYGLGGGEQLPQGGQGRWARDLKTRLYVGRMPKSSGKPLEITAPSLFEVGAHDADQIIDGLSGRLTVPRHVVANVVLHQFGHEAVDRSPGRRKSLKNVCALFIIVESTKNGLQLPDNLLCAIDKVQLFP
jgi:hypothetical protein